MRIVVLATALSSAIVGLALADPAAAAIKTPTNIAPQELSHALRVLAADRRLQVLYTTETVANRQTPGAIGEFTVDEALTRLLSGTGLVFRYIDENTIAIMPRPKSTPANDLAGPSRGAANDGEEKRSFWSRLRLAQADNSSPSPGAGRGEAQAPGGKTSTVEEYEPQAGKVIPEVLVKGSRSLNMDIERTRDDAQPYVVLDRATIERSSARTIDELLRDTLTSTTGAQSQAQTIGGQNTSSINLRGLGATQTLVLVDGHRIASQSANGAAIQGDINAIPLAAIERIEILPATASGIYGGSATGGVVNVVLRRDYSGVETKVTYGNSFDGGGSNRQVDLAAGFNFEGGRTNLLIAGSYSDATDLLVRDRDFTSRGREAILQNNPAFYYNATTPPLGATTNIRSVNGSPLTVKSQFGGGSLGSAFTYVPPGYDGPASDNAAGLRANAGQYNFDLADTVQTGGGGDQSLRNTPTVRSIKATLRRQFTSQLDAFLDLGVSENKGTYASTAATGTFVIPGSSTANPFNQDVRVTTPAFGTSMDGSVPYKDRRAVGGLIYRLPAMWVAELDHTWDQARYSAVATPGALSTAATTAVSDGTLSVFQDTNEFPVDFFPYLEQPTITSPSTTTMNDTSLRLAGPLGWSLPGGAPAVTLLLEHRREAFDDFTVISPTFTSIAYSRAQSIDSVYLESRLPLVSGRNGIPGIQLLELQLAGRHDRYDLTGANQAFVIPGAAPAAPATDASTDFTSTDPTAGLRFQPLSDVTFRASYGTGFAPPSLAALVPGATLSVNGAARGLTDPRRGGELTGVFNQTMGGNPDLRPEESRSRSVGMILTPRFVPGLRVSADWVNIEKRDNIQIIPINQNSFNNELNIPGYITRGPASGGFDVGPIIQINSGFINVARQRVEAIDFAGSYRIDTRWGGFNFLADGTRNLYNSTQVLATLPGTEAVGLESAPKWRANASLDWDYRQWSVGWSTHYTHSYFASNTRTLVLNLGSDTIPTQIYHDIRARYRFDDVGEGASAGTSLLSGLELQLGVRNVLNERPPLDTGNAQFYSPYGDPRLRNWYLTVRKAFF